VHAVENLATGALLRYNVFHSFDRKRVCGFAQPPVIISLRRLVHCPRQKGDDRSSNLHHTRHNRRRPISCSAAAQPTSAATADASLA
jgi:hypothetical protein